MQTPPNPSTRSRASQRQHGMNAIAPAGLGVFIKQRRAELNLSQRQLAKRAGIEPAYMSQIESNTKLWPRKYIAAIARELKVSQIELAFAASLIDEAEDSAAATITTDQKARIARLVRFANVVMNLQGEEKECGEAYDLDGDEVEGAWFLPENDDTTQLSEERNDAFRDLIAHGDFFCLLPPAEGGAA